MKQKIIISKDRIRKIVQEEWRRALTEAEDVDASEKKSYEISAAADALSDAITTFNDAGLPEVPDELKSCLKRAKTILDNMSDNPGQYKGGRSGRRTSVEEGNY